MNKQKEILVLVYNFAEYDDTHISTNLQNALNDGWRVFAVNGVSEGLAFTMVK